MIKFILIIVAACLSPLLLLRYIVKRDKYNPEPHKEVWKAFGYGAFVALASVAIELLMSWINLVTMDPTTFGQCLMTSFVGASLTEEGFKLLFLYIFVKKSKFFDENIDGIVYAAAISMGFASIENLVYLVDHINNWQTVAIMRSLFSVPGHFMFAVAMGYYFSLAYFKNSTKDKILTFAMPFLFHGLYDTFLFSMRIEGDTILLLLLLLLLLMIYLVRRSGKAIASHLKRDLEQYILSITPPDLLPNEIKETK